MKNNTLVMKSAFGVLNLSHKSDTDGTGIDMFKDILKPVVDKYPDFEKYWKSISQCIMLLARICYKQTGGCSEFEHVTVHDAPAFMAARDALADLGFNVNDLEFEHPEFFKKMFEIKERRLSPITLEEVLELNSKVTWNFANEYFFETREGNFIWSCPEYPGGDNTLRKVDRSYDDWISDKGRNRSTIGRSKGIQFIGRYLGKGKEKKEYDYTLTLRYIDET